MTSNKLLGAAVLGAMVAGTPALASTVSNDQAKANTIVTTAVAPVASAQTASLIAGAVGGAVSGATGSVGGGGAPSGGFAPGPQSFNSRQMQGKSGGSNTADLGMWVNGIYSHVDKSEAGGEFDGDVYNFVGGVDYRITQRVVAGVALGYEHSDITTKFNSGTFKGDGFTVAPYVGVSLTPNWSADLSVGHTWLNYDTERNNNAVNGTFDANRWFGAANLNGTYTANRFVLMPKVGVMYLNEEQDSYTDSTGAAVAGSTIKLGRASAGGSVGYQFGSFMPYVKLIGEWDFEHPGSVALSNGTMSAVDDFGGVAGAGVNFNINSQLSGTVEGSYNSIGRSDLDVWSGQAKLRYKF